MRQNAIYTNTAHCQDCYRCVRVCPVKAIRISGGQAQIVDDLCIQCGTCVRECPQGAKTIRSDLDLARAHLASGQPVAASVAPSFAALFTGALGRRVPAALRQLGFRFVGETAEGAKYVTEKSIHAGKACGICTACPVVVNYVEKYQGQHMDALIPVVSPMVAHGRMLKARHPGCAVVFIGPCAAKKQEILRVENAGAVDVVLTFDELLEWFHAEGIQLENCTESSFDGEAEIGDARLFPIQGGMLKTGGIPCDGTEAHVLHLSGAEDVQDVFSGSEDLAGQLIEPLFCKGGCIAGPALKSESNLFERRKSIIDYAGDAAVRMPEKPAPRQDVPHKASFTRKAVPIKEVSENRIHKILERTGKINPANQLNCGACGYKSCLDNAVAVARGMAEPEMCIPYMRRLAQQRTDRIIETTPNGVVILDSELCMIKMNPAFQRMFLCNNGILGRRISYLVNAEGFESLQTGAAEQHESIQTKNGVRYHEIIYALREEGQFVGIYSDISKIKYDPGELDVIKKQTLMHAREFLDHQVRFAQEMAHYLGKSTAQSEEIAKRLISLYEEDGGAENRK